MWRGHCCPRVLILVFVLTFSESNTKVKSSGLECPLHLSTRPFETLRHQSAPYERWVLCWNRSVLPHLRTHPN
jgi:hypothetical protein